MCFVSVVYYCNVFFVFLCVDEESLENYSSTIPNKTEIVKVCNYWMCYKQFICIYFLEAQYLSVWGKQTLQKTTCEVMFFENKSPKHKVEEAYEGLGQRPLCIRCTIICLQHYYLA